MQKYVSLLLLNHTGSEAVVVAQWCAELAHEQVVLGLNPATSESFSREPIILNVFIVSVLRKILEEKIMTIT